MLKFGPSYQFGEQEGRWVQILRECKHCLIKYLSWGIWKIFKSWLLSSNKVELPTSTDPGSSGESGEQERHSSVSTKKSPSWVLRSSFLSYEGPESGVGELTRVYWSRKTGQENSVFSEVLPLLHLNHMRYLLLATGDEGLFKCCQEGPLTLTLCFKLLINILDLVIFLSSLCQWHLATGSQFSSS